VSEFEKITQYQNPRLKFCKVLNKSKRPFETDWVNKPYSHEEIKEWVNQGKNFGVICGYGKLLVIDADHQDVRDAVTKKLKPTFRVRTGSGGCHDYYFCKGMKSKIVMNGKVLDKDGNPAVDENGKAEHYGEVQFKGTQVVGAGSIHPNGETYSIERDLPIEEISIEEIEEFVKPFMDVKVVDVAEKTKGVRGPYKKKDKSDFASSDINSIPITEVLERVEFKQSSNPEELFCSNPWHGSTSGTNTNVNPRKNKLHCFRCDQGMNTVQVIAREHKIINSDICGEKLSNVQFRRVLKIAEDVFNLQTAKVIQRDKITAMANDDSKINMGVLKAAVLDALTSNDAQTSCNASELLVLEVYKNHDIYTIRTEGRREMWMYMDGIYVPQGETYIKAFVRGILGNAYKIHLSNEVLAKIEADTYIDADEFFNKNKIVDEVCLENGILNLVNRKLMDYNPEKIFFNKLPVKYNPDATCPTVQKHFETVLKHKEDSKVMYELFGFLLWKDYFIEKAFMFLGDGRNGKSKTLDLMKRFIGIENCSDISISALDKDPYALGELFGKMANISGDINKTALENSGNFKKSTGRDLLGAPRKFLNRLNFVNYAKMVFCANDLPKIWEDTDAMWRRWMLFEFPYTFVGKEEYDALEKDKGIFKLKDNKIIEALSTPSELSGLLNGALDALDNLHETGEFSYSKNTSEVRDMWIRKSDSLVCFMLDRCEKKFDSYIIKDQFNGAYSKYCAEKGLIPVNEKSLKGTMERMGAWETRKNLDLGTTQTRVWNGWRLF